MNIHHQLFYQYNISDILFALKHVEGLIYMGLETEDLPLKRWIILV